MELKVLIEVVVVTVGITLVYDARSIAKKVFSYSDQNGATLALKVAGFLMSAFRWFASIT